jgi:putative peptide zinc metalloprotease protein
MTDMVETKTYRRRRGYTIEPIDVTGTDGKLAVRFENGKRTQITRKLNDVLTEIDGKSSCEEIAGRLAGLWQTPVTAGDVEGVVERFLRPYQLVVAGDEPDSAPAQQPVKSWGKRWLDKLLLQDFFFSFRLVPREHVTAITRHTAFLFSPAIVAVSLAAFVVANWFLYREVVALRAAAKLGLTVPSDYLLVLLLLLGGVLFHEIGHATAVSRYGAVPDHIGFGLYFIYPALFANVNESWRFTRGQRVVVDLAGIYFQILAMLVFSAVYFTTHRIYFLYAVFLSETLAVYSLIPFFKFDGYWCLADALGVPNLRKRSFQYLATWLRRLATRRSHELPVYLQVSPAAGIALVLYALGSVVFFGFVLHSMALHAPALYQEYPAYASRSVSLLARSFSAGLFSEAGVVLIRLVLRTFVLLGLSLILLSLGISLHQTARRLAQRRT